MKQNDTVKLSVIILTYNSSETIRPCLESLVHQTVADFKIIVVDDDSTDSTLEIVRGFKDKLKITIKRNGAHNISRGRNIGLKETRTPYAAFIDSDARAKKNWANTIIKTLDQPNAPALISGEVINAYRTTAARSIALNDETIRDLFWKGDLIQGCNLALNHKALGGLLFDEAFIHADDLEYTWKVQQQKQTWKYVAAMSIHHESRSSFKRYANQMYKYGFWKLLFGYRSEQFNWIDFVPLVIFISSLIIAIRFPVALLCYPLFCVAETLFIILYKRPNIKYIPYILMAWFIKNTAWSAGIIKGAYTLFTNRKIRTMAKGVSRV